MTETVCQVGHPPVESETRRLSCMHCGGEVEVTASGMAGQRAVREIADLFAEIHAWCQDPEDGPLRSELKAWARAVGRNPEDVG